VYRPSSRILDLDFVAISVVKSCVAVFADLIANNLNNLYWNQVDKRNLLQWHTKQAATQDSTTLYNRTQSFGT